METSAMSGATGAQSQQAKASAGTADAWSKIDLQQFIGLLIAELQNQDPMDPMDNSEILQQISQIREISSNEKLTQTLSSVQLGQTVATASGLIGQTVIGLSDDYAMVTGKVERISIEDGEAKIYVGEHTISLDNVSEIMGDFSPDTSSEKGG